MMKGKGMKSKRIIIWEMNGPMNQGGTESLIMEMLRNKPDNVEVRMVIHSGNGNFEGAYDNEIKNLGITMYYLPSVGSVGYSKYKEALSELVKRTEMPDVIHSHMNAVGGLIAKAAKSCGINNRIVHCHANIKYQGSKLRILKSECLLWLMKIFVNKYANYFWACSNDAAKRLFGKNKKYTVISNTIDARKYLNSRSKRTQARNRLGIEDERVIVGAVGRIARIKNYEVIIDALSVLKKRGIDAHFCCYGRIVDEKYFNELKDRAKEKNVHERIAFLGGSNKIFDDIVAFDIFVMPSITEGLGISALEAQAAGLQAILSTGVPEETDMGLGLVKRVSPYNPVEWANAIENRESNKIENDRILNAFQMRGFDSKSKISEIYDMYITMSEENRMVNNECE